MAKYENGTLVNLRQTLQTLKQKGALESSFKLQYAVDKTLRDLTANHGNSEAHALEAFDDARQDLLEQHAEEDEEGRTLYEHRGTGAVIVRDKEEDVWRYAEQHQEDGETHQPGQIWGDAQKAREEAQHLAFIFGDEGALQEDLETLREEKTEVDLHQVPAEELTKIDLSRVGRQVDTSALELMEA